MRNLISRVGGAIGRGARALGRAVGNLPSRVGSGRSGGGGRGIGGASRGGSSTSGS